MEAFTVTPIRKGFRIEETLSDGSRTLIAQVRTEAEALKRLKVLQRHADLAEKKKSFGLSRGW